MATYVAVHGGFDGGWAWSAVAKQLRSAGHDVYTPTLTGSGERVHLASPDVSLNTWLTDVTNVILYQDLGDVILVGHSSGGFVACGAAPRVSGRIAHLVVLDGLVPQDGESMLDIIGPELSSSIEQAADEFGDGWRMPHTPPDADRRTDLLLRPARGRIRLESHGEAPTYRRTFVSFTAKPDDDPFAPLLRRIADEKRVDPRWDYRELPVDHFPFLDNPQPVAALLIELAGNE